MTEAEIKINVIWHNHVINHDCLLYLRLWNWTLKSSMKLISDFKNGVKMYFKIVFEIECNKFYIQLKFSKNNGINICTLCWFHYVFH